MTVYAEAISLPNCQSACPSAHQLVPLPLNPPTCPSAPQPTNLYTSPSIHLLARLPLSPPTCPPPPQPTYLPACPSGPLPTRPPTHPPDPPFLPPSPSPSLPLPLRSSSWRPPLPSLPGCGCSTACSSTLPSSCASYSAGCMPGAHSVHCMGRTHGSGPHNRWAHIACCELGGAGWFSHIACGCAGWCSHIACRCAGRCAVCSGWWHAVQWLVYARPHHTPIHASLPSLPPPTSPAPPSRPVNKPWKKTLQAS